MIDNIKIIKQLEADKVPIPETEHAIGYNCGTANALVRLQEAEEMPTVTQEQLDAWVGNQGYADKRDEWMLKTLTEIANGEYTAEQLNNDIVEYGG
jgi:hypothetical protein